MNVPMTRAHLLLSALAALTLCCSGGCREHDHGSAQAAETRHDPLQLEAPADDPHGHEHEHAGDHDHDQGGAHGHDHGHDHGHLAGAGAHTTGRIELPDKIRRSIGVTFAQAELRPVSATLPVPGYFELLPAAQHHYPLPATGRVTIHVKPLQRVEPGQLLIEVDAPAWRELQRQLVEARATRSAASAELARARAAKKAAGSFVGKGGGGVYAASVKSARVAVAAAEDRFEQHLAQASTLTGWTEKELAEDVKGTPRWRALSRIPVRAVDAGVVRDIDAASGTWVAESTEIVHVVHTEQVRFRGRALQADLLDRLRDGLPARVLPPPGRGRDRQKDAVAGSIRLGVTGDPASRTVDVFIDLDDVRSWMRPQVAAVAEISASERDALPRLAIPRRAVIDDGLESVFFRRAQDDPDVVIRTVADLGPSDGDWVAVRSGLAVGDEVVVDGVYQLGLATSDEPDAAPGGHVHADGTWHDGSH